MISNSKHKREIIRIGEAYRWEIEQAQRETRKVQQELDRLLDIKARLVRGSGDGGGYGYGYGGGQRAALMLDVSELAMRHEMSHETGQRVSQRLLTTLMGLSRDHRPDMRQTFEKRDDPFNGNYANYESMR